MIPGVTTLEQAHAYLGVTEGTADDFVMAMYTAKVFLLPGHGPGIVDPG